MQLDLVTLLTASHTLRPSGSVREEFLPLAIAVDHVSKPWAIVLGVIFAAIAVGLAIASWTRWGQNKPLTKCVALAVLAHIWLLMYAYGTRVLPSGQGNGSGDRGPGAAVAFEMLQVLEPPTASEISDPQAGESGETEVTAPAWAAPLASPLPELAAAELPATPPVESPQIEEVVESLPVPEELLLPQATDEDPAAGSPPMTLAQAIEVQESEPAGEDEDDRLPEEPPAEKDAPIEKIAAAMPQTPPQEQGDAPEISGNDAVVQSVGLRRFDELPPNPELPIAQASEVPVAVQSIPEVYRLRFSTMRSQLAASGGGDASTEAAVDAALAYLAASQRRDGSWSAAHSGAGRETRTLGEDRGGAGGRADTAITGLALLALMGGGHTPEHGRYAANAAAAAEYLVASQMPSGDLAGPMQVGSTSDVRFARMYSHGIALLALAECYAIARDPALHDAVLRGARYTLQSQNPYTGGWRYDAHYTGDPGDMSQFGWQAMALLSCRRAGFTLPADTDAKQLRFLDSVAAGPNRGLAVYRPVPGQRPTVSMTAEALASRYLLGQPISPAAASEASQLILQNLPGQSEDNLYYFYYATLALHQQQGDAWQRWNAAMKQHLVDTQVREGAAAGSWNPTCIWGGYGGRVYSTAVSCMCLEVYYRYIPMYGQRR